MPNVHTQTTDEGVEGTSITIRSTQLGKEGMINVPDNTQGHWLPRSQTCPLGSHLVLSQDDIYILLKFYDSNAIIVQFVILSGRRPIMKRYIGTIKFYSYVITGFRAS